MNLPWRRKTNLTDRNGGERERRKRKDAFTHGTGAVWGRGWGNDAMRSPPPPDKPLPSRIPVDLWETGFIPAKWNLLCVFSVSGFLGVCHCAGRTRFVGEDDGHYKYQRRSSSEDGRSRVGGCNSKGRGRGIKSEHYTFPPALGLVLVKDRPGNTFSR